MGGFGREGRGRGAGVYAGRERDGEAVMAHFSILRVDGRGRGKSETVGTEQAANWFHLDQAGSVQAVRE